MMWFIRTHQCETYRNNFPLSLSLLFRGVTTRRFVGHTKDVLSVAFSADNRQIVSGARDHTIKLWNTLGVCKYTIQVIHHSPPIVYWFETKFKLVCG